MCRSVKTCVIVVGRLECVMYELLEETTCWNKQLVDNRNWGKPSRGGLRQIGEGKGAAQPHHAEGETVYPQKETEMDSFARCYRR
jgi:hypothetical protein